MPLCQSHTVTSTGHKPATIRNMHIATYTGSPHFALRHGRGLGSSLHLLRGIAVFSIPAVGDGCL